MTRPDVITDARAVFMARLSELEDLHFEAGLDYGHGPKVGDRGPFIERIRIARRAVVAAYDQATLGAGKER